VSAQGKESGGKRRKGVEDGIKERKGKEREGV